MTHDDPIDTRAPKHVVGLSGGKDSTAMALWLVENEPREYEFICNETGNELPEMQEHWRKLEVVLGAPIKPVRVQALDHLPRLLAVIP